MPLLQHVADADTPLSWWLQRLKAFLTADEEAERTERGLFQEGDEGGN